MAYNTQAYKFVNNFCMETTYKDYPMNLGYFSNPEESSDRVDYAEELIDKDIVWLETETRTYCVNKSMGHTRVEIAKAFICFEMNVFEVDIEQATKSEAKSVLKFIHKNVGPNGTCFWIDTGDDDDTVTTPPSWDLSSLPSGSPLLVS